MLARVSSHFSDRRFLLFRLPWFLLAVLLLIIRTLGALFQPPRPDPFEPVAVVA